MPSNESIQDKQERVRKPRVHIKMKVNVNGAIEEKEIPFVMGVLSDLSGHRTDPLPPLAERTFKEIDRDNFDRYLGSLKPRLALKVKNELQPGDNSQLQVELNFRNMDDFDPEKIVEQVEPLRRLMELRRRLKDLQLRVGGNEKLDTLLQDVIKDTQKLRQVQQEARRGQAEDTTSGRAN